MSYIINYDEARNLFAQATTDVGSWSDLYSSIKSSFEGLVSNEDFTGSGADQIKQYISEVHLTVCYAIETIATEYVSRFLLFLEGLYTYDTDIHAVLCEEDMTTLITNMENVLGGIEDIHPKAVTTSSEMSDIITSSISTLVDNYVSTLYDKKEELVSSRDEIGEYDHNESAVGMANLKSLVADILGIVDALREGGVKNIETYEPGSIIGLEELNSIYEKMTISQQYVYDNQENINKAIKHLEAVYEQIEDEMAEERWKQGLQNVIIAGAMLFMVFATKGMFSPMFLTTIGVPTATHQVCNGLEGVQDIYYGLKGDIYTASYNPYVEAYKYLGLLEEAYYINDMLLSGTYAVMVPLNQFSAASISGGNIALARWSVCQDVAIDLGTDWAVSHVCELCGADDYVATLAGLSIGTMAGFGGGKYDVDVPYPYIHGDNVSTNANWLNNYGYAGGTSTVDDFIKQKVNPNFQQNVREAFMDDVKVTVLEQDMTVYRYHGGGSNGVSYWYTPNQTSNPAADLALPQGNTYQYMDTYVIPKGTTILEGTVAPNFGQPGGGYQYYVSDPSVVIGQ